MAPSDHGLFLRLETVVTPEHPLYEPPKSGEQHCYRLGWLTVEAREAMDLSLSRNRPAIDATGKPDFGNVDAFVFDPARDRWDFEGD